jgi:glyceraldehyde 3-phosphate dehydrogenase
MQKIKVGINGFGRIGRAVARIALQSGVFEISLINTRKTPNPLLAYLLQYDSVYRTYSKKVTAVENGITVDGVYIPTHLADSPSHIPWSDFDTNIVLDCTGAFTTTEALLPHISGTVKKVVLSAPAKDDTPTIVLGVNDSNFDFAGQNIISNASCTTNCVAPMIKVLQDAFGVDSGYITTAHAYTLTQSLLDDANKTPDRSRAASINIAPSTTGAAKAVAKVIPQLKGKLDGMALRVPVPTSSFTDVTAIVSRQVTKEEVNAEFKKASLSPSYSSYLAYETEILVSSDYIGSSKSVTFDSNYTNVIGGNLVKIFGWYDNEWGYSSRIVDLVQKVGEYVL